MEEYAFPGAAAPHCEYDRYDNCTSPDLAAPVANEPYSTPPLLPAVSVRSLAEIGARRQRLAPSWTLLL
jgi:hypothetical protein